MKKSRSLLVALLLSIGSVAQAQGPRLNQSIDLLKKQVRAEHFHNTSYQNLLLKNGRQEYFIDSQYYYGVLGFYKLGTDSNRLIQSWSFMPYSETSIDATAIVDSLTLIHGAQPEKMMGLYMWELKDSHCTLGFSKKESGNRFHYSEFRTR